VRSIWAAAFAVNAAPTVIYVDPQGPAKLAGLQVNDAILSVNGDIWPEQVQEQNVFLKNLSDAVLHAFQGVSPTRRFSKDSH
jgi:predicted metalloprotease with PDZ domain